MAGSDFYDSKPICVAESFYFSECVVVAQRVGFAFSQSERKYIAVAQSERIRESVGVVRG